MKYFFKKFVKNHFSLNFNKFYSRKSINVLEYIYIYMKEQINLFESAVCNRDDLMESDKYYVCLFFFLMQI